MSKTLLLWFEAPLQSWGYNSKFFIRDTLDFPTKSSVLGILFCAMGLKGEQSDALSKFANLKQTVYSFKFYKNNKTLNTPILVDYQVIGNGYNKNNPWEKTFIPKATGNQDSSTASKIIHKKYIQDGKFAVLMEIPDDMVDLISKSLKSPMYPIYLGRKNCIPTDFVFQGIFNNQDDADKYLDDTIIPKKNNEKSVNTKETWELKKEFKVIDGESNDGDIITIPDIPLSFGMSKQYISRKVTKIYMD